MARGEGSGWHHESRRHHDAAMDGRRPRTSTRRSSPKVQGMTKMEENALKFAIRHQRAAMEEANLPEFEGKIRTLNNSLEKLRFDAPIDRLNKNQRQSVESALEWTMKDMGDGSSYRDYNGYGSFDSIRKKDLQGALAKVREAR